MAPIITDITMPGDVQQAQAEGHQPHQKGGNDHPGHAAGAAENIDAAEHRRMVTTASSQPIARVGRVLPSREVSRTAASPAISPTSANSTRL